MPGSLSSYNWNDAETSSFKYA